MDYHIINSFIFSKYNNFESILNYIEKHYNRPIIIVDIKKELTRLLKNDIIKFENNDYYLTDEGNVILNDNKYYNSKIIINFYKRYSKIHKRYELKEKRLEQEALRKYLIENRENKCIICSKKLPLCLLETAHIKPRCILNKDEMMDNNIVEFMCRYCHTLYDKGYIGVDNNILYISSLLGNNYDIDYNNIKGIINYNDNNKIYFNFHYKYIFCK
jgi:hypothetical protein